ncbi:hypothetical protein [uncultured Desulfobacter sp.]|uniref:hypothetical protein n=1 Tax=uncultured Desulfobacter sp. TaxID=240139 RepID=UPI0029C8E8D1|nr:hypothetical protein [uncultured Desulfobacter sp.]
MGIPNVGIVKNGRGQGHLGKHISLTIRRGDIYRKCRQIIFKSHGDGVCGTLVEGPIKAGDAEGAHADGQIHHIGPNAAAQRVGHPIRRTIDQNRRHIIAAGALQYKLRILNNQIPPRIGGNGWCPGRCGIKRYKDHAGAALIGFGIFELLLRRILMPSDQCDRA